MTRKIFQTICGCLLMACLLYLGAYSLQQKAWGKDIDKIRDLVNNQPSTTPTITPTFTPSPTPTVTPSATPSASPTPTNTPTPTEPVVLGKYEALYELNNDLAGWIRIEDTVIDYPVMHIPGETSSTGNGYYYMTHDFYKRKYTAADVWQPGCLFIDGRCIMLPDRSENLIIYGHKMQNGTMFAALLKFRSEDFYKKHKSFTFDTIYSEDRYEIAIVLAERLAPGADYFNFLAYTRIPNKKTFDYFVENCKKYQLYETGVKLEFGDELVTLVTCLDDNNDGNRIAVIARKIK